MKTKNLIFFFGILLLSFGCSDNNDLLKGGDDDENIVNSIFCNCIMDTLKGEWSWIKTYTAKHGIIENEYKSVIKILNQNEDASINYAVFVSDTLFSEGYLKLETAKWYRFKVVDLYLPYFNPVNDWYLQFEDVNGKLDENILTLFSGNDDDNTYYYQKNNKSENQPEICNVDNPLTDLPWLKAFIDDCEANAAAGYPPHARIYQCAYRDGIGFLLDICVGCPDAGLWLRSCDGESLCIFGGLAGNTCPELEFNVDFENKKLIWESNY